MSLFIEQEIGRYITLKGDLFIASSSTPPQDQRPSQSNLPQSSGQALTCGLEIRGFRSEKDPSGCTLVTQASLQMTGCLQVHESVVIAFSILICRGRGCAGLRNAAAQGSAEGVVETYPRSLHLLMVKIEHLENFNNKSTHY